MSDIVERLENWQKVYEEDEHLDEGGLYILAANEIKRLRKKCDMQAMILQRITPEQHPGVYFIWTELGTKDRNGMPEKFLVVPAYGCDFSYVYERRDETVGPEW